ncbi:MAG: hypothetical protein A3E82_04715 [Gammaproteobacteria bacterium RIFCSPHIGHO2_12_FULL_38_11]|nr:MAG: hypothetical protein A3E82_04715 [Gammaproteobacteria bacterium RIFCSPHIGHO2_12_FULL_38_11]
MSLLFSQNKPRPIILAIICPTCAKQAIFISGISKKICKKDIPLFEKHPSFGLCFSVPTTVGVDYYAVYFPGLHEPDASYLSAAPDDQPTSRWTGNESIDNGTAICDHCLLRKKHFLRWPTDAFFQWKIRHGKVLWAWNREHAVELRDYILSKNRTRTPTSFSLPADFKKKSVRDLICKKINASLLTGLSS